jgi:VWFA-related protein
MRALGASLKFSAVVAAGILALIAARQTLSPGEVRIHSQPYVPQSQILRAESRLVRIGVVVRDGGRRIVSGLKSEDFAIFDNGKKQTISAFSVETHAPSYRGEVQQSSPSPPRSTPTSPGANDAARQTPRFVALYFDDLHTKSGDMKHVQVAAENFVHQGLTANDQVALFTASSSASVGFTADTSKVLDALAKLKSHERVFDGGTCPRITPHDAYLIASHLDPDAYNTALAAAKECNCDDQVNIDDTCYTQQERVVLVEAQQLWEPIRELSETTLGTIQGVLRYLAKAPGDRVLVLASPGFFASSLNTQVDAIVDEALRAGIVINALDAKGLYTEDPTHGRMLNELQAGRPASAMQARHEGESFAPDLMSLTAAMADFALGTGGSFFHDRNDLTAGYYSLAAAPETEYLIGFEPEKSKLTGSFHKLKVQVNTPGTFDVQARPGYFAPTKEPSGPSPEEKIDGEVRGSEERSDFPLSVSEKPGTASNGGREISVETRVDIQKLPFQRQKDQYVDMLTIVAALFDAQGKMIAGKEAQMELALKPESFERFSKTGISGAMSLEAPPGAYRLRVVAQEAIHGEMSATSQKVQIQ